MTISSQIFDPKNAVVHIATGQPCESEYVPVGLPGKMEPLRGLRTVAASPKSQGQQKH